jgi:hypothetical protein
VIYCKAQYAEEHSKGISVTAQNDGEFGSVFVPKRMKYVQRWTERSGHSWQKVTWKEEKNPKKGIRIERRTLSTYCKKKNKCYDNGLSKREKFTYEQI